MKLNPSAKPGLPERVPKVYPHGHTCPYCGSPPGYGCVTIRVDSKSPLAAPGVVAETHSVRRKLATAWKGANVHTCVKRNPDPKECPVCGERRAPSYGATCWDCLDGRSPYRYDESVRGWVPREVSA